MFIIAGHYRHHRLFLPKGEQTRPSASRLRESLFNICQFCIEGVRFLDLFAGSGAVGLEALSRGAKEVFFVDDNRNSIECIKKNISSLKVENNCQIFSGDVLKTLELLAKKKEFFDIIFADPPYRTKSTKEGKLLSEAVITCVDQYSLLSCHGRLFIEEDYEYSPELKNLIHLKLCNSRRIGAAVLQQYTI